MHFHYDLHLSDDFLIFDGMDSISSLIKFRSFILRLDTIYNNLKGDTQNILKPHPDLLLIDYRLNLYLSSPGRSMPLTCMSLYNDINKDDFTNLGLYFIYPLKSRPVL